MTCPRPLQSAFAALLAACVVLLGLAAVSPRLHEHLCSTAHGHESADHDYHSDPLGAHDHDAASEAPAADDHVCAVTLFAAGCETPPPFSLCPAGALRAEAVASFTDLLLSRTLRGPERVCGPPAAA